MGRSALGRAFPELPPLSDPAQSRAMTAVPLHVAGFESCPFFRNGRDAARSLSDQLPNQFSYDEGADGLSFASRDLYKAWLASPKTREMFQGNEKALKHTSSPLCFRDLNVFIGGCDDILGLHKELLGCAPSSSEPASPPMEGQDGVVLYSLKLLLDMGMVATAAVVLCTVRYIPPLRRFIKNKVKTSELHTKVNSSYDESALIDNAFEAPLPMITMIWQTLRRKRASKGVTQGETAPDVQLVDLETGEVRSLLSYHKDRPLILNFGSAS